MNNIRTNFILSDELEELIIYRMTDHQKFKALQKELNLNYHDIAKITGHTYGSVKDALQPNKPFPRWLKLVLYVWEKK